MSSGNERVINQLTSLRAELIMDSPASKFDRLIDLYVGMVCEMVLTLTGGVA